MDNNIIEEVCGLEMLTQLQWLDLSFNNIEEISGLEKLTNLKDLSLANNRLKAISNLDSQIGSLQILSVANNLIEDKKNVRVVGLFKMIDVCASHPLGPNQLAIIERWPTFAGQQYALHWTGLL